MDSSIIVLDSDDEEFAGKVSLGLIKEKWLINFHCL